MADQRSGRSALASILRRLAEQLGLQTEYVIQDTIYSPALEAMVGDHSRLLEVAAERGSQRTVHSRPSTHLRLLEQLEAAIERELAEPVLSNAHVPSTSTLPESVTLTLTTSREDSP